MLDFKRTWNQTPFENLVCKSRHHAWHDSSDFAYSWYKFTKIYIKTTFMTMIFHQYKVSLCTLLLQNYYKSMDYCNVEKRPILGAVFKSFAPAICEHENSIVEAVCPPSEPRWSCKQTIYLDEVKLNLKFNTTSTKTSYKVFQGLWSY